MSEHWTQFQPGGKKSGITKKQLPVLPAGYNISSKKHHCIYIQELTSWWSTYLFTKLFDIRRRAKNQYWNCGKWHRRELDLYGCCPHILHAGIWGSWTLALDGAEWSASQLSHFMPGKSDPSTHWVGGRWVPKPVWMLWRI